MSKPDKYQIQLQQEIDCKASFMNATKWMYLFSMLKKKNPPYMVSVKLLLEDEIRELSVPDTTDFIHKKYLEAYWGVFELKEIEWILIPSEIRYERKNREEALAPKVKFQNMGMLEQALLAGKQYEYERSAVGLKVYGYK